MTSKNAVTIEGRTFKVSLDDGYTTYDVSLGRLKVLRDQITNAIELAEALPEEPKGYYRVVKFPNLVAVTNGEASDFVDGRYWYFLSTPNTRYTWAELLERVDYDTQKMVVLV